MNAKATTVGTGPGLLFLTLVQIPEAKTTNLIMRLISSMRKKHHKPTQKTTSHVGQALSSRTRAVPGVGKGGELGEPGTGDPSTGGARRCSASPGGARTRAARRSQRHLSPTDLRVWRHAGSKPMKPGAREPCCCAGDPAAPRRLRLPECTTWRSLRTEHAHDQARQRLSAPWSHGQPGNDPDAKRQRAGLPSAAAHGGLCEWGWGGSCRPEPWACSRGTWPEP